MNHRHTFAFLALAMLPLAMSAQQPEAITVTEDYGIRYNAYSNGDRVPDYSFCGYMASDEAIPDLLADASVPVVRVSPSDADDTGRIQDAIDYIGSLPVLPNGFRGVVLLERGRFVVGGSLYLRRSGVVIRGAGVGATEIFAAGNDRETLVKVKGVHDPVVRGRVEIADGYVPVGASRLGLKDASGLAVGASVMVTRPSTAEWISLLRTDHIGDSADYRHWIWKPGDFDSVFERRVVAVDGNGITLDVPLPMSFDASYGGGYVSRYEWNGRVDHIGIENLRLVSEYDASRPRDEDHRWMAVTFDDAQDCWVRRVEAVHFVSSAVAVWDSARRITVEDCKSLAPVGEIGGFRRMAFQTLGQQTLFSRCWSEDGYNDFTVGQNAAGPNAFVQCASSGSHSYSGAVGGWSCGTLFDRVTIDGQPIMFTNMFVESMGGGYASANALCWQCRTPQLHLEDPALSHNWAFGTRGQSYGNGSHGEHRYVLPDSFYLYQLGQRGRLSEEDAGKMFHLVRVFGFDDPLKRVMPEAAYADGVRSAQPVVTLSAWIDSMVVSHPLADTDRGVALASLGIRHAAEPEVQRHPVSIVGGKLSVDGGYDFGGVSRSSMWQGMLRKTFVRTAADNINRFVPGRDGHGMTDHLDSVVLNLKASGRAGYFHHPALWYERRRDDHGRARRANPDVWAPFLEQPFARSGEGEAFDRLSKYDLDRFNPWYWKRLADFAALSDENGLFLVAEHYLQHNIIEEGAHWADYPWRSANNINEPGFAEPTYSPDDNRVFMANEFYDVAGNPRLAAYHRKYIRQHLDALRGSTNVIHHIGIEYTGPLQFMRFWLDCIAEWERDNSQEVLVMLSATKDVQDAILEDPAYRKIVDIIDIRQWAYGDDGSVYAPLGGVNLAPRQYQRVMDSVTTGPDAIWRQVSEYRTKYPEIAVVNNSGRSAAWVPFVAGGSMCAVPAVADKAFSKAVLGMSALDCMSVPGRQWGMGKAGLGYVVYSESGSVVLDLTSDTRSYRLRWIDPVTGAFMGKAVRVKGGAKTVLEVPGGKAVVGWMQ